MNTQTNNKILLYDDYCPLCTWYSKMFVKYGLLGKENRMAFSKAPADILTSIDIEKGKDEIPLFDATTRTTVYGIDALLEILGQKNSAIKFLGELKAVKWFLKRLYKFISYNRKVVVAKKCGKGQFDCSPGFNSFYRILFLVIFFLFNSLMLLPLHDNLFRHLSFYHLSFSQLQEAHLVLVSINCTIAVRLGRRAAIEYLGQINMLALTTILLLSLLMVFINLVAIIEWLIIMSLASLTLFVIKEYFRRMQYANVTLRHKEIIAINLVCLAAFLIYIFH